MENNVAPTKQTLEVAELDNLDRAQLEEWLIEDGDAKPSKFGGDGHGDLGLTTAIVIVSIAAIKALAPILVRNKHRQIIKRTNSYIDSAGVTHTVVTEVIIEAEWSEAEVIAAIGKATGVDVKPLLGS